jgi:hypothetical protein
VASLAYSNAGEEAPDNLVGLEILDEDTIVRAVKNRYDADKVVSAHYQHLARYSGMLLPLPPHSRHAKAVAVAEVVHWWWWRRWWWCCCRFERCCCYCCLMLFVSLLPRQCLPKARCVDPVVPAMAHVLQYDTDLHTGWGCAAGSKPFQGRPYLHG